MDEPINQDKLSDAACLALWYCRSELQPGSPNDYEFHRRMQMLRRVYTSSDLRALIATGLQELFSLGLIDCKRGPEGDAVPARLHEEKLDVRQVLIADGV